MKRSLNRLVIVRMMKRSFWRTGLLLTASFAGVALTGCATDGTTVTADNTPSSAPDPAWYQSNDNPFHAD